MIAIIENYQQADGSIMVPEVLTALHRVRILLKKLRRLI